LKYRRDIGLGEALARPLVKYYRTLKWQIDLVVPIPLGDRRRAKRGYNQVALLAYPFALSLGIPYRPNALRRVRDTRSQVGLSFQERQINVQGAFRSQANLVQGKNVLVMDDVTTTGATIRAGSVALVEMGARKVYGLTLARAVYQESRREK
jgi:ComF family protein